MEKNRFRNSLILDDLRSKEFRNILKRLRGIGRIQLGLRIELTELIYHDDSEKPNWEEPPYIELSFKCNRKLTEEELRNLIEETLSIELDIKGLNEYKEGGKYSSGIHSLITHIHYGS